MSAPVLKLGGEEFRCRATVPQWHLLKLAKAYKSPDPMETMAGMYDFVQSLVLPEEFARLDALLSGADMEDIDLDNAIGDAMMQMAGRGKESPSSSSDGSATTSGSLPDGSPLPVRRVQLSGAGTRS